MAINPFKAGRAVGKGVTYLTKLGSKIGKSIGSSVDKLGAGTRNTQASVIKGARGARDAVNSAGAAAGRAAKEAKAGYDLGRRGGLHLSDVADKMPTKSSGSSRATQSLSDWINSHGKGYMRNPGTMPGNDNAGRFKTVGDMYKGVGRDNAGRISNAKNISDGMARRASASSPGSNGKNWAVPIKKNAGIMPTAEENAAARARADKYKNYMTKGKPATSGGGIINKPPRPPKRPSSGSGDYMSNSPRGGKYSIGTRISDDQFVKNEVMKNTGRSGGMSKNRRAGIITAGSIAAGYGVHKGNEALQNHYQRQKNASRGM